MDTKAAFKKTWHFLWHSDSVWSWLANLIIAFFLIKFIIYPGLGIILGTGYPIVAVISESMEHSPYNQYLCGQKFGDFKDSFGNYWQACGSWYENKGFTPRQFQEFSFLGGFYKGDIIIVWGSKPERLEAGDIIVFQGSKPQPIIHRLIKKWKENDQYYFQTKGDHNSQSLVDGSEDRISEQRLLGKGVLRIPYLGWIKIIFVQAVKPLGWNIVR